MAHHRRKSRQGEPSPAAFAWRILSRGFLGLAALLLAAPLVNGVLAGNSQTKTWQQIAPNVFRSQGLPCAYALVDGSAAVLIGAPDSVAPAELPSPNVETLAFVLLTHHHRDSTQRAGDYCKRGIPVRAPAASAPWLTVEGVKKFWDASMPAPAIGRQPPLRERTFGLWNFLVHARGIDGIECSLQDQEVIDWQAWRLTALATPGHSADHMAFVAQRKGDDGQAEGPRILFCGDALCAAGKIWSPYTTDWDHWTGRGLSAAADSLRKLAALEPDILCPEHGAPITEDAIGSLRQTAKAAEEAAFLKSFERYTKERLGDPPKYAFLASDQVATPGDRPWSRLSKHLFLTGNTYALLSDSGAILLMDPYGPWIVDQVSRLQKDHKLGAVELAMISHAHNDHYRGIFLLPDRKSFQVWTLSSVARPIARPYLYCAPYLEARPVQAERRLKDGETAKWREYRFRFHHFPGQTEFTMGVETVIDGKKCFFTADNFFHADQFSGSGGWSGHNRALPLPYAQSAQKVLDAAPDWVLAEHGGAFVFDAEDFRRRASWAKAAAQAADALSVSGDHRRDWDPQRVHVEPLVQQAKPGREVRFQLVASNPTDRSETLTVRLAGNSPLSEINAKLVVEPGQRASCEVVCRVVAEATKGRHIVPLSVREADREDGSDTFLVIVVE